MAKDTAGKPKKETAGDIKKRLEGVLMDQSSQESLFERHFFMYGHSILTGQHVNPFEFTGGKLRINIVQSCVDTLLNKITKNLPRATFLTDGGDWDKQQSAKKREKFVYGAFHKADVYKKTPLAALHALAFGDGFVKVYKDGSELKVDAPVSMAIVVDEKECAYNGSPRSWWQIQLVDRDTLAECYPEHEKAIKDLPTAKLPFYMQGRVSHNLVEVIEYWKLPLDKDSVGTHCIITGSLYLLEEEYKTTRPPFRRLPFVRNLVGYRSKGVAEVVTPYQIEANRTLVRISDALRLVATPKVLMEYQSKVVKAHLNNDVGAIVEYMGTPPQFVMPQAVGTELFTHLQWCVQQAYNDVGISLLSANSQKPAGLNSGKALREYNDIETERFAAFAKAWETFHMEIAEDCLSVAKEISEEFGKYSVISPDPKGCEIIDFKDIDSDGDAYVIQPYPTSQLPKDPAGRLEYVTELLTAQLLTPEEGMLLLDFPDTEKITALKTSELDDILATCDYMLTKDKYLPPEPFQNLDMGIQLMKKAYLMYKNKSCPDSKLDLLIRWINDAMVMLQPPETQEPAITSDELTGPTMEGLPADTVPQPEDTMPPTEQLPVEGQEAIPPM